MSFMDYGEACQKNVKWKSAVFWGGRICVWVVSNLSLTGTESEVVRQAGAFSVKNLFTKIGDLFLAGR